MPVSCRRLCMYVCVLAGVCACVLLLLCDTLVEFARAQAGLAACMHQVTLFSPQKTHGLQAMKSLCHGRQRATNSRNGVERRSGVAHRGRDKPRPPGVGRPAVAIVRIASNIGPISPSPTLISTSPPLIPAYKKRRGRRRRREGGGGI
jgi:hypothetical protein